MTPVLNAVSLLIAIVASIVGVVVALDQLTIRTRLRRIEGWVQEQLELEDNPHRQALLKTVRLNVAAGIAATVVVPAIWFTESVVGLIVGPGAVVLFIYSYQHHMLSSSSLQHQMRNGSLLLLILMILGMMYATASSLRGGIRYYFERHRVIGEYVRATKVIKPPSRYRMVRKMEGSTARERWFGVALSIAVNLIGVGVGLTIHDIQHAVLGPAVTVAACALSGAMAALTKAASLRAAGIQSSVSTVLGPDGLPIRG